MKKLIAFTLVVGLAASAASAATQLNVRVVANGSSNINVSPGEVVNYQVLGQLQDTTNQGLALFAFDLACVDCGPLEQASPPDEATTPGISQFVSPLGMNNPAGFGGTTDVPGMEGQLVQIGGATNTILNTDQFAQFPLGTVVLGLGHEEAVLAEGQLTIPNTAGAGAVYTLAISNVFANTILEGEMEDGTHWAVEAATQGTTEDLVMTVSALSALAASTPGCNVSLTRPSNSVIRLQFTTPIPDPVLPGDIEIRELLDAGGFGADISDQFTFTVEGGNVLRIAENDNPAFANETWYGIMNTGNLPGVQNFEVDYRVVFGDANNSGFTNFADLSAINAGFADPTTDWDLNDINASGFVNFADLSAAFSFNDAAAPDPKPSDHSCTIP